MSILVIGSSGGIGSDLCRFHLKRNDGVTTIARSGADHNVDLRSNDAVYRLAGQIGQENQIFKRIYVASGTLGEIQSVIDMDLERLGECFDVNVMVPVRIIKWFSRFLAPNGSMVFFSGGGASTPKPYFGPYAASKAALVRLIETAANEDLLRHVRMYAIGPGPYRSQMLVQISRVSTRFIPEGEMRVVDSVLRDSEDVRTEKIRKIVDLCDGLDTMEIRKVSGRFYSAVWDDPSAVEANLEANLDSYTLRRIDSKYFRVTSRDER